MDGGGLFEVRAVWNSHITDGFTHSYSCGKCGSLLVHVLSDCLDFLQKELIEPLKQCFGKTVTFFIPMMELVILKSDLRSVECSLIWGCGKLP